MYPNSSTPFNSQTTSIKHIEEWKNSGVPIEIIEANIESISDEAVAEKLLGSLGDSTGTYLTKGDAKRLESIDSPMKGGGWVSGLDPDENWVKRMEWGQFKPDTPRLNRKYESPSGVPARATFLDVPEQPDFWSNVEKNPDTPLYIVEGAKKAGCLLGLEYAAVSVPGIWNPAPKNEDGNHQLIPDLKRFTQKGRQIIFVYDRDGAPRKERNVYKAIKACGRVFQDYGCDVSWVTWPSELGKGIDDVFMSQGKDIVNTILSENLKNLKTHEEEIYCVGKTVEQHTFENFFEGGKGDWAVFDQAFYKYTGQGYWQHVSDAAVEKMLCHYHMNCYRLKGSKDNLRKVFDVATDRASKSTFSFCRKALAKEVDSRETNKLRCFKNCTVDMSTKEILKHNKEHCITSQIDAEYRPNQECPAIFKDFIGTSFGEENVELIRAVTSMFLDPTAPYGYFPYLLGKSGGGKGTLIGFWQSLFDPSSVSSGNTFSDIGTPEGRHQYLRGRSLYCFPDVGGYIQGVRAFYELVENGALSGRALYNSTTYHTAFHCRFVVASVNPLTIENSGDGWDRRQIVIPVKNNSEIQKDPDLKRKLSACKADVISWALSMLKEERDFYIMYSSETSETVREATREMALAGNPIKQFVDMCLVPDLNGYGIPSGEVYRFYEMFCKAFGYKAGNIKHLVTGLENALPDQFREKRRKFRSGEPGYKPNTWKPANFKLKPCHPELFERDILLRGLTQEGGLSLFTDCLYPQPDIEVQSDLTQVEDESPEVIEMDDEILPGDEVKIRFKTGWKGIAERVSGDDVEVIFYPDERKTIPINSLQKTRQLSTLRKDKKPPSYRYDQADLVEF